MVTERLKKRGLNGSSTIEAALLMPLLLAVIFMLVYLMLFLHTRAGFVRNGYLAVLRGSQAEQATMSERSRIARTEFEKLAKDSATGSVSYQASYADRGEVLSIHVTLEQKLPRILFSKERLQNVFTSDMTFSATTRHPVAFIRSCRRIGRVRESWEQSLR
ncbi:MAG: pilus assembly protein [Lachnospiraceae bacterium]|nr:pilus assembly protein [Lachnospiraceae bacterium]